MGKLNVKNVVENVINYCNEEKKRGKLLNSINRVQDRTAEMLGISRATVNRLVCDI